MNKKEIVAFKKDNKVYTLCKKCKAETFKSETKESIVGIDWAIENGYKAIYKDGTMKTELKNGASITVYPEGDTMFYNGEPIVLEKEPYIPITERELAANISDEEKHEGMWKGISNIFDAYKPELKPLMSSEEAREVIKNMIPSSKGLRNFYEAKVKKLTIENNELKNTVEKLTNISNIKFADLNSLQADLANTKKQLDFALEMNKKLKSRNLFQRILNN